MPSRQKQIQDDRDTAFHLLKKSATAEAALESAEALDEERSAWASLAAIHEERARFARLQADNLAQRVAARLIAIDAEPPEPTPPAHTR